MSSFRSGGTGRRAVVAGLASLALSAPSGCGFRPALGTGSGAAGLTDSVAADAPVDRKGFEFTGRIEERLGRPAAAAYRLSYEIETAVTGLAITPENATTRYNIDGTVRFRLTDTATGATVTSGSVRSFAAYSAAGTSVSTAAQAEDAMARLMRLLADQVVTRLIAAAAGGAL